MSEELELNTKTLVIIVLIMLIIVSFFAGIKYNKTQNNLSPEEILTAFEQTINSSSEFYTALIIKDSMSIGTIKNLYWQRKELAKPIILREIERFCKGG